MDNETLVSLAAEIVCAHAQNNIVAASDLPRLIQSAYAALAAAGAPPPSTQEEPRTPAVPVRSSVKPGAITCLECGAKLKTLKRHLAASHGITTAEYRSRWALPASYPMVTADYSEVRRQAAITNKLGRKPGQKPAAKAGASGTRSPRRKLKLSL